MDDKIEIFVSYSHQDAEYLGKNALLGFLKGLEREGVEFWADRELEAGETWDEEVRARIRGSDLALLLVSQAFLDSRYCTDVEVRSFLKKSREDGLRIVPILLSPCEWERHEWLSSLQALPGDGRTIEEDYSEPGRRKRLFLEIRRQLREQIEQIRGRKADDSPKTLTLPAGERPPEPPREASLLGRTLSHYRILDLLGTGGMGEVYVAEDSKLHRKVALKVLPREMAADPGRLERFEREARALAALNHPNIITIYSVEQADGVRFITMELVAGKTLDQVIPRGGLGLERLLALALPLADALSAAHERGITHRDLKPANVMVSDEGCSQPGRVKVLDFGLAKRREGPASNLEEGSIEVLTEEGQILGTVPYMSPEQIQGKPLDSRSDIFSLGIVLYEMITGERPFRGETSAELISAILRDTPPPVDEVKIDLPHHLARILKHALEKDPRKRYQSALDLRHDLAELEQEIAVLSPPRSPQGDVRQRSSHGVRRAMTRRYPSAIWAVVGVVVAALVAGAIFFSNTEAAAPTSEPSILVLPFTSPAGEQADDDFAAGITEDILTELSRIRGVKVMAQSATRRYRVGDQSPREIGRELGVAHVLMGSVRRAGTKIRIVSHLVDTVSERQLWAQAYDRELSDVFTIQQDVARRIAGALGAELTPAEKRALSRRPSADPRAYELYLRGWERSQRRSYEATEAAIDFYQRAVAADPEFALAWARLAAVYVTQFRRGGPNRLEAAREAVAKALALDDELAEAHHARGMILAMVGRLREALEAYRRTLEIAPSRGATLNNIGFVLASMGRWDEAFREYRRSIELDPLSPVRLSNIAELLGNLGFHQQASLWFDRVFELEPYYVDGHRQLAYGDALYRGDFTAARRGGAEILKVSHDCCLWLAADLEFLDPAGDKERALELYRSLLDDVWFMSMHAASRAGYLLRVAGKSQEAEPLLERVCAESPPWLESGDENWWHRWNLALAFAAQDQPAEALSWYRDAVDAGRNQYWMDTIDPTFEALRGEEAFQHQIERMRERVDGMRRRLGQSDDWETLSVPPIPAGPKSALDGRSGPQGEP